MTPETAFALDLLTRITLLLTLAWALHLALARANPVWRVLLWRGVALGLLLLPALMLVLPSLKLAWLPATRPLATSSVPSGIHTTPQLSQTITVDPQHGDAIQPTPPSTSPAERLHPVPAPINHAALAILLIWCLGVTLLALRWILAEWRLRRHCRLAQPAPEAIDEIFTRISQSLNTPACLRIGTDRNMPSPFLFGRLRPVVILPQHMTAPAYRADLAAIFAHELHHARTHDLAWITLLRLAQTLLWFHPLAWPMRRALVNACELACDAAASAHLRDREAYASTLARVALENTAPQHGLATGAGLLMARTPHIRKRLARLALRPDDPPPGLPLKRVITVAGISCVVLFARAEFISRATEASATPGLITRQFEFETGRASEIRNRLESLPLNRDTLATRRHMIEADELIVHDSPENIARIEASLSGLRPTPLSPVSQSQAISKVRQKSIFLGYATAEALAQKIDSIIQEPAGPSKFQLELVEGVEQKVSDLTLLAGPFSRRDPADAADDEVVLSLRSGQSPSTQVTLRNGQLTDLAGCRITAEAIYANRLVDGGHTRLTIETDPLNRRVPSSQAPEPEFSLLPSPELNALVLRYSNPETYIAVRDLVDTHDRLLMQFQLDTFIYELDTPWQPHQTTGIKDQAFLQNLERTATRKIDGPLVVTRENQPFQYSITDPQNPQDTLVIQGIQSIDTPAGLLLEVSIKLTVGQEEETIRSSASFNDTTTQVMLAYPAAGKQRYLIMSCRVAQRDHEAI